MTRSGYIAAIRRLVGGALVPVPSVTACIFDERNRLLLLRHADRDVWATAGGTIEPGESPADAVVREKLVVVPVLPGFHEVLTPPRKCGAKVVRAAQGGVAS